ncbi:hypothetical protein [Humisphaera borealis]|uniref:General stress protein 17M-like domain-containing protein n=1 Tax=Humisphaera borealis TaxID=2807512 RepID=A0A7M2X165_9BACT|nr:hypothetical protein [Humisphaera borealis]QOV91182.1 hypothetical protein IPV69_07430 [Humisphaera borealis]
MNTYTELGQSGEFLDYPTNKVIGVFANWEQAQAAIARLTADGFTREQIGVLAGSKGARRLDASGEAHGILAQLSRFFSNFADLDAKHVARHEQELEAGHVLVAADGEDEARRERARQVLKDEGGYFINYYGKWFVENLEA